MEINKKILVTGASGYLASHIIKQLLELNFSVIGTVRSLSNKSKSQFLKELNNSNNLILREADLLNKKSWNEAVKDCQYVIHVASPIPPNIPQNEDEIIIPAVEGTLNVLEASLESGIKKVVITSSGLSIILGNEDRICSEEDWSDISKSSFYSKSKILAEKAVWEFYEKHKDKIEITVMNPTLIFGPLMNIHGNSSEALMASILSGSFPGIPEPSINYSIVDVRDAAKGHIQALFNNTTNGNRVILSNTELVPFESIVEILKDNFHGYILPKDKMSKDEIIASGSKIGIRTVNTGVMGKKFRFSNEKSIRLLSMNYMDVKKTIIDMANSLIKLGIVNNS